MVDEEYRDTLQSDMSTQNCVV